MQDQKFILFSGDHLISLLLIFSFSLALPLFYKKKSLKEKATVAWMLVSFLISMEIIKSLIGYYYFVLPWVKILPLHMCNMSSFSLGLFMLTQKRIFFEIPFFWGIGGGLIAFLMPDIQYTFPHLQFLLFFIGHGLFMVSITYICFALNMRPYFSSVKRVICLTLFILPLIFLINKALGSPANYWYLGVRPEGKSVLTYFPKPPWHIPFLVVLGSLQFFLMYLPYWIYDQRK